MTLITLPSPFPPALTRVEKPTPSSHALPAVAAIAPLADSSLDVATSDRPTYATPASGYKDRNEAKPADTQSAEAFSALRFADPLPDLPELDLPAKAAAYQAALNVVRTQGED